MLILAFDTTSDMGGVEIFRDAECLALVANEGPANRYSITLFEMVEQALAQARLELREIELFAAANGPGAFTGIRVGLAAARAWGKAFDRKARGVSVLEALANKASPGPDWVFPILDARRGEFFVGGFRKATPDARVATGLEYEPADKGWVLKPDALRAFLEERAANGACTSCLVRAHDQAAGDLRASLPASLGWQQIKGPLMDSIAAIAWRKERSNLPSDANLDAHYIRRPDAEVKWKD
jgi:tRNA threonylcarbamoyladenosine biosynthesis protein TsaB